MKNYWLDQKDVISENIAKLWRCPERPFMEYQSSAILADWLEENGFEVTRKLCGMPTAFRASYGKGEPVIGILAEYDALPGLSNDAVSHERPLGQSAGHACLHCHIGAANTGAAIAVKEYLAETGQPGTVVVTGCPAEELLWGKLALLGEGGFEGLDVVLTSHVDYQNASLSRPTLSGFNGEYQFSGVNSHSGAARSRNALDGVELAVATIERMRGHQFPKSSVEHVIRNGGIIPGITPNKATLWVNARDADYEKAKALYKYLKHIIHQSAKIAHVDVKEGFVAGSRGYLPNDTLGKLLFKNLQSVGAAAYTEEEMAFMAELSKNESGSDQVESSPELVYLDDGVDPYSQDDGEVSWHIPLGRVNWEIPSQIPLHSWSTTALAGMPFTHKGALMASQALYLGALELLNDTALVKAAKDELETRLAGREVSPPLYGSFDLLTTDPGALWDGTWLDGPADRQSTF